MPKQNKFYILNINLNNKAENNATNKLNTDENNTTRQPNSFHKTTNVVKQGKYNVTKITNTTTCDADNGNSDKDDTPSA
jgi:hypothetical protein